MKSNILKFVIGILLFVSCTDTDSTPVSIADTDLLGTWNVIDITVTDASLITSQDGETFTINTDVTAKDYDATATFTDSPKEFTIAGGLTLVTTIGLFGETETTEYPVETLDNDEVLLWSITGDVLTLTDENGENTVILKALEYDGNRIRFEISLSEIISEESITVELSGTAEITLEK